MQHRQWAEVDRYCKLQTGTFMTNSHSTAVRAYKIERTYKTDR